MNNATKNRSFLLSGLPLCGRLALCIVMFCAAVFSASSSEMKTITVLRLQNCTEDESLDWIGIGLADMTLCLLRGTNVFELVEREKLGDILEEHSFSATGFVDPASAARAGRIFKADLALGGGYTVSKGVLDVSVFIVNTKNGQVAATASWRDTQSNLLNAPSRLLSGLLATYGKPISEEDITRLAQAIPRNLDAVKSYYQGVQEEIAGNPATALKYYLASEGYDDAHPMLSMRLGRLYFLLGEIDIAAYYAFSTSYSASIDKYGHMMKLLLDTATRCERANRREMKKELLNRCIEMGIKHEKATGEVLELKKNISSVFKEALKKVKSSDRRSGDRNKQFVSCTIFRNDLDLAKTSWFIGRRIRDSLFAMKPYRIWINAQFELAGEYIKLGETEKALEIYEHILDELKCVDALELEKGDFIFDFKSLIPGEAQNAGYRAIVEHAGKTGKIIRNPRFINLLDHKNPVFTREKTSLMHQSIPAVGRSSWNPYGYSETLSFAAPDGMRIAGITVQSINVQRKLIIEIGNENPLLRYGFGRGDISGTTFGDKDERQKDERLSREGESVDFVFDDMCSMVRVQVSSPAEEYLSWRLKFRFAPLSPEEQETHFANVGQALSSIGVKRDNAFFRDIAVHWDNVRKILGVRGFSGIRGAHSCKAKSITVGKQGYLYHTVSLGGDIRITQIDPPSDTEYFLPASINTENPEENARLYFWQNGRYQLVWTRHGQYEEIEHDTRFRRNVYTAFSRDLRTWSYPRRVEISMQHIVQLPNGKFIAIYGDDGDGKIAQSDDSVNWTLTDNKIPEGFSPLDINQDQSGTIWLLIKTPTTSSAGVTKRYNVNWELVSEEKHGSLTGSVFLASSHDAFNWTDPLSVPMTVWHHDSVVLTCLPGKRIAVIKKGSNVSWSSNMLVTADGGKTWETFQTGLEEDKNISGGSINIATRDGVMFMLFGRDYDGYYIGQSHDMFTKICGIDATDLAQAVEIPGVLEKTDLASSIPTGLLTLPFNSEGMPEEIAPIAEMLSWHISSHLANAAGLPLVDRTHVSKMLDELGIGLGDTRVKTPDNHVIIAGRILGAKYMISGSIRKTEQGIEIISRVFDVETTRIVASASDEGSFESLESTALSISKKLASQIDVKSQSDQPFSADLRPLISLYYMRGLVALYSGQFPQAVEHFAKTLMDDPGFIDARFYMAKAYMKMGKYGEAYIQFHKIKSLDPQSSYAGLAEENMTDCLSCLSADEIEFITNIHR